MRNEYVGFAGSDTKCCPITEDDIGTRSLRIAVEPGHMTDNFLCEYARDFFLDRCSTQSITPYQVDRSINSLAGNPDRGLNVGLRRVRWIFTPKVNQASRQYAYSRIKPDARLYQCPICSDFAGIRRLRLAMQRFHIQERLGLEQDPRETT